MFTGVLNKMRSEISNSVKYFLDMNNEFYWDFNFSE